MLELYVDLAAGAVVGIFRAIGFYKRSNSLGHVAFLHHIGVVPHEIGMEHRVCRRGDIPVDDLVECVLGSSEGEGLTAL